MSRRAVFSPILFLLPLCFQFVHAIPRGGRFGLIAIQVALVFSFFFFSLKEEWKKKVPVDSLHITYFGGSEKLIPSAM